MFCWSYFVTFRQVTILCHAVRMIWRPKGIGSNGLDIHKAGSFTGLKIVFTNPSPAERRRLAVNDACNSCKLYR